MLLSAAVLIAAPHVIVFWAEQERNKTTVLHTVQGEGMPIFISLVKPTIYTVWSIKSGFSIKLTNFYIVRKRFAADVSGNSLKISSKKWWKISQSKICNTAQWSVLIAESFWSVNYGLSIITSNNCLLLFHCFFSITWNTKF